VFFLDRLIIDDSMIFFYVCLIKCSPKQNMFYTCVININDIIVDFTCTCILTLN
jgi:hypothetical protein